MMHRRVFVIAIVLASMVWRVPAASQDIDSPDGKYRLTIEFKAEADQKTIVTATMKAVSLGIARPLWKKDIAGDDPSISPTDPPPVYFGEDGSFFVFRRYRYFYEGWALVNPSVERSLGGYDRDRPSYFISREPKLVHLARIKNTPVVAIWDRDEDSWTAFNAKSGEALPATPELIKQWNEARREEVLRKIDQFRAKAIAKKIETAAPAVARFLKERGPRTSGDLTELDLEFLAVRRDARDRIIFERIIDAKDPDSARFEGFFDRFHSWGRPFQGESRGAVHFEFTNTDRMAAARLLAVMDGKAEKKYSMNKSEMSHGLSSNSESYIDREPRRTLGEIFGSIQCSTPIRKPMGIFRFYLIPGDDTNDWTKRPGKEMYEHQSGAATESETPDNATFAFTTINPGKYFLKAIWDRRAPLTDLMQAGPGDYESAFVGPFDVKAGGVITNVTLVCTNRASRGEEYYRADEAALQQWENGEITPASSYGAESFLAVAAKWILKTNAVTEGRRAWINSIALRKDAPCKPFQSPMPGGLTVYVRERDRAGKNELSQLEIRDAHGCAFKPTLLQDASGLAQFYFPAFPRADATWTLAGLDTNNQPLFDYTLTNLVLATARELPANPLPLEIKIGARELRVAEVIRGSGEHWEARLDYKIFENGNRDTNWIVMDARFLDRHGNATTPTNFCREEKTVRITGRALNRWTLRGLNPMSVDVAKIPASIPFEFAVPRESIKASD